MKALPQQVATAIAQCLTWKSDLSFEAVTQDLQAAADILHPTFRPLKCHIKN